MSDCLPTARASERAPGSAIAIVGMACLYPKAANLQAFWHNILRGVDAVSEPTDSWEAERYLKSGKIRTAQGGYLRDLYRFNPAEFGVMPSSLNGGEPDQFLALSLARDALLDAGYLNNGYDHSETGIVLGHSTYLHRGQGTLIQNHIVIDQTIDLLASLCPELDEEARSKVREVLARSLPSSSADIAPALVPNVMTGRIANRLNLKGPNFLVDAACSSSLLAVASAMDELRAGRSRMMLAGGVNASLPAEVSVIFSQLGALSSRGRVRPFESGSDGTLLGEGLGVVVLKRLDDALSDEDRIYSVIREVGQASDGKGQGLLAPSVEGETLAIRRAYAQSGVDPSSITLIEAHGTGIPLGDKTEIASLKNVFGNDPDGNASIAVGSVKSMISHCIPAAGIAGLIKSALALHHKTLPPTLCDTVNPELGISSPLFINTKCAPWISPPGTPRRAGINSFGFGGINTHAIVEEAPTQSRPPLRLDPWSAELCVFAAETKDALISQIENLRSEALQAPDVTLPKLAQALATQAKNGAYRLSVVADDLEGLQASLKTALTRLASEKTRWFTRTGLFYSEAPLGGKLAFLFPGEGSQYQGMLSELSCCFDEVRQRFDFWSGLYGEKPGQRRTDIAFPNVASEGNQELAKRLHGMDVGSEAVFMADLALHDLLLSMGVRPDAMLGHSSGESAALAASGALRCASTAELESAIKLLNSIYLKILADGKIPTGALLSVGALDPEEVARLMQTCDPALTVAMDNCKNQVVIYGAPGSIQRLQNALEEAGAICFLLPFDRGYHTSAFSEASSAFLEYYETVGLTTPGVPLYSCSSTHRFPNDVKDVRRLAAAQWSQTVRFRETIKQMHNDGFRTFIEVGPSGNLSAFVSDILAGSEYQALPTNLRQKGALKQLLQLLGQLFVEGHPVNLQELFRRRAIETFSLVGVRSPVVQGLLLDNTMPRIRLSETDRAELSKLRNFPEPTGQQTVSTPRSGHALNNAPSAPVTDAPAGFLTEIIERSDTHLVASCELNVEKDRFLQDHVLSGPVSSDAARHGLSCVPLMVSLEIMAQACAELAQSRVLASIEQVRAFDWIALDHGEEQLEVRAIYLEPGIFEAELRSHSGLAVRARYRFTITPSTFEPILLRPEMNESKYNGDSLYSTGMFHGPLFQSIQHIEAWNNQSISAQLTSLSLDHFFIEGERPHFITNPVLMDAMGQLAAFWIANQMGTGFNCFPSSIEKIELLASCPENPGDLRLLARQRPVDEASVDLAAPRSWDFECVSGAGRSIVRVTGLVNVFFHVPASFYGVRSQPLLGFLGTRLPTLAKNVEGLSWSLTPLESRFCTQSSEVFLRILVALYLHPSEKEEWWALQASLDSRKRWLFGRACLKEALRTWVFERTGTMLHPGDVQVLPNVDGSFQVGGSWRETLIEAPAVTLSEEQGVFVASVTPLERPLGIVSWPLEDLYAKNEPLSGLYDLARPPLRMAELEMSTSSDASQP